MSTEIWILLVLVAATGSALITFFLARRGAPTRKQLTELEAELESAREDASQVEGRVSEHFERSAVLFGHLAKDYKAFLDHYSDSAQALGLSERRARELLEKGYQPLLTHLEQDVVPQAEAPASTDRAQPRQSTSAPAPAPATAAPATAAPATAAPAASSPTASIPAAAAGSKVVSGEKAGALKTAGDRAIADKKPGVASATEVAGAKPAVEKDSTGVKPIESTASKPEPPLMKDVVDAPASVRSAKVVDVDLNAAADARAKVERQAGKG